MLKAAEKLFNNLAKLAFELRLAINSKQMKNNFFNSGKVLSKEQTKKIIGGQEKEEGCTTCTTNSDCSHITRTCESGTVVTAICNTHRSCCATTCVSI